MFQNRSLHTCERPSLTLGTASERGGEVSREGSCCRTSSRLASKLSSTVSTWSTLPPELCRMPREDSHDL